MKTQQKKFGVWKEPYYFCNFCDRRHSVNHPEMKQHIEGIEQLGFKTLLLKQGKSSTLHVRKR